MFKTNTAYMYTKNTKVYFKFDKLIFRFNFYNIINVPTISPDWEFLQNSFKPILKHGPLIISNCLNSQNFLILQNYQINDLNIMYFSTIYFYFCINFFIIFMFVI